MYRKILFICLPLFLLAFIQFSFQAQAQTLDSSQKSTFMPPGYPNPSSEGFLGQDHSYSVTFRGNGEAVVSAKIIFTNSGEEPLDTISLRVPRVEPKDISIYQVIREPYNCLKYKPQEEIQSQTYPYYPVPTTKLTQKICEEYSPVDYYQSYWSGKTSYQKAKFEAKSDTIIVTLPKEVKANSSGSFIVYYRALGYAGKNILGAYNFTFETLKVDDKIRNLRVGIVTDSDLYLRGAKGKVSYRFDEGIAAITTPKAAGESLANTTVDKYYQQIGYGTIEKTARDLQPLDSYIVKGSYADAKVKLYGKEILLSLFITAVFIAGLFLLVKFIVKKIKHYQVSQVEKTDIKSVSPILLAVGLSFFSSIFIVIHTLIIRTVISVIVEYFRSSDMVLVLLIALIALSVIVYGVLFLGSAIYMGMKKGWGWGLGTLVATILWLGFYLVILIIFLFIFAYGATRSIPMPTIMR